MYIRCDLQTEELRSETHSPKILALGSGESGIGSRQLAGISELWVRKS